MTLYNFGPGPITSRHSLGQTVSFALGESVYDKAWEAYAR